MSLTRKVDDLNRVVLPKDLTNELKIYENTVLKITRQSDSIIIKKYLTCCMCESEDDLIEVGDKMICQTCKSKIANI